MNKMITAALLVSSLSLSSAVLLAGGDDKSEYSRVDKKLHHMTEYLDLTDDQIKNIKPILSAQHASMQAIKAQNKEAISAYLTEEQKVKLNEMRKGKHKGKKGQGKSQEK